MSTYSFEHQVFLKKKKRERILIGFSRLFIIVLFLSIWEYFVQIGLLNSFLYSSPSKISMTILSLIQSGQLFKHILITLYEVFISFFISSFLGIFIAFLFWRFPLLSKILDPYLTILNSLPKVALGPLIIIWVGAGTPSIILMALLISIFSTIIQTYTGFISVPERYLILLKSFQAKPLSIFTKLILPYNYENIISCLKINISLTLIGVIMGELLVSKSGLGYLIMYGSQIFQLDLVISSIVLLGIISYLMYFILDKISIFIHKKRG